MRLNNAGVGRLARITPARLVAVLVRVLAIAGAVYTANLAHADETRRRVRCRSTLVVPAMRTSRVGWRTATTPVA
ncbi:MAG TPA: hypothetical protein VEO01_10810, partial [Pseudonocardiaceae bacterium]|nr:hypothetical protein [Pseudonocardiaceae bacterium]